MAKRSTDRDVTSGRHERGALHYTLDVPVILMHKLLNGGEPVLARLVGAQRITGDWRRSVLFEWFAATLNLPAIMYGVNGGYALGGPRGISVQLASADEVRGAGGRRELVGTVNTARFDRGRGRVVGQLALKAEAPLDSHPTCFVVPFTCALLADGGLEFAGTGTALNGRYAGLVLACCGPKKPAPPPPPPCVVTIATTARAAATNAGGAMGFTGLVQKATSSVGHLFPAGNVTVGISVWWKGQTAVRPGVVVPLAANGTLTYPAFGALFPTTWSPIAGFPPDGWVDITVKVTDVAGDVGAATFSRRGDDVP